MANSVFLDGQSYSGSKTVTTAGTRVQLETTYPLWRSIVLIAKDNNTGRVYVGGSDVASTTNRGLGPGDTLRISSNKGLDLSDIYLDASVSGEGVDFYASV